MQKEKNAKLILVGDGSRKRTLQEIVEKYSLEEQVIFVGNCANVSDYLMAMDIFVFPSLYEGLGIALIEAQASGLPCLIADNIPTEADISDLVFRLPLQERVWLEVLDKVRKNPRREEYYKQAIYSGYDIKTVSKTISEFYIAHEMN